MVPKGARRFRFLVLFVCAGYLTERRTFAYFGVPGLYPGEALLLWAAFKREGRWLDAFFFELRRRPLLPVALISFLSWGVVETLRGYRGGYSIQQSVLDLRHTTIRSSSMWAWQRPAMFHSRPDRTVFQQAERAHRSRRCGGHTNDWTLLPPWKRDVPLPGLPAVPCLVFVFAVAFARRMDIGFATSSLIAMLGMLLGQRSSILGAIVGLVILLCRPKRRAVTAALLGGTAAAFAVIGDPPAKPCSQFWRSGRRADTNQGCLPGRCHIRQGPSSRNSCIRGRRRFLYRV